MCTRRQLGEHTGTVESIQGMPHIEALRDNPSMYMYLHELQHLIKWNLFLGNREHVPTRIATPYLFVK